MRKPLKKLEKHEIVKVQVSMTMPKRIMIYNENRSIMYEGMYRRELDPELKNVSKAFFSAVIDKDNQIVLKKRLPEQGW